MEHVSSFNLEKMFSIRSPYPPFSQNSELVSDATSYIPNTNFKVADAQNYLRAELSLKDPQGRIDLDEIRDYLWMAGVPAELTKPLHYHKILGRQVGIAEEMRLHLTWNDTTLFLKPIPHALLNYKFFNEQILQDPVIYQHAIGYLHTYLRLLKHESDFNLAMEKKLLPKGTDWNRWLEFTANFPAPETDGSSRWDFGELRISRINFIVRIFRLRPIRGWISLNKDTTAHFTPYFTAVAALFAVLSLALSSFQVAMAPTWAPDSLASFGYWFSVACLLCAAALGLGAVVILTVVICSHLWFIVKTLLWSKKTTSPPLPTRYLSSTSDSIDKV